MAYTREEQISIANTILQQLGGGQFRMMTGAKNNFALDSGLQFQLPRAVNKVKTVRVILDADDTYTVEFYTLKGALIASYANTYCDQLRGLFEDVTGLRTSLGTMRAEDRFARDASSLTVER